ncbi:TetR family transcriptional regulator [Brevibacterium permense]|nr:TetR family transcriptional regulator [Brevibacterium permense]
MSDAADNSRLLRRKVQLLPKIVDHEKRKELIADAVVKVIARVGFERLTMRELAAELGYAHGTVVRYFPSKRALLTASFLNLYNQADARIGRVVEGKRGFDALDAMCREILPLGESGRKAARVVLAFWARASQDDEIMAIHDENNSRWRQQMRSFLVQAREDGAMCPDVDIDIAASELAARNAGWQMQACLMAEVTPDEVIEESLRRHIDSLRRR